MVSERVDNFHRDFNHTFPLQVMGDISYTLGRRNGSTCRRRGSACGPPCAR